MRQCASPITIGFVAVVLAFTPSSSAVSEDTGSSKVSRLWSPWREWKMPSFSPPEEPEFLKSTRNGVARAWEGTKRSTKNAWIATKDALRPYDPPEKRKPKNTRSRSDQEQSFWANLFGGKEEPKRTETVNDFLRQPMIY